MIDDDGPETANPPGRPGDGDAVEHLWNAAHEMLRAMRTLVDAADEFVESQRSARPAQRRERDAEPREGRVHHIDIDVRTENHGPGPADAGASTDARTDADAGTATGSF
jgi:hypothetical protein